MIRVALPAHLRNLASITGGELELEVEGPATQRTVLDALEARYPMLRGTLRDHATGRRRPFVRFFACEEDLSHESPDTPLPPQVVSGAEPFLIVGAIAGGADALQPSPKRLWAGRILLLITLIFLLMDGVMKVMKARPSVEGTVQLGYPESDVVGIGILVLCCTLLYAIPRSAVFGAILLTGYLGGAIASQVRIGAPLFSTVLFPVYFAVLVWAGLYLRDDRVRAIIGSKPAIS